MNLSLSWTLFADLLPEPHATVVSAAWEPMGKDIELAILFADVVGSTKLYEALGVDHPIRQGHEDVARREAGHPGKPHGQSENQNFRFRKRARASYPSPAIGTTNPGARTRRIGT